MKRSFAFHMALSALVPVATAVFSVTAQARPRDDVMSTVFRCGAIGDSRQWLDCYYGAAQPVRSELGLPPVPLGQAKLVASPPTGGPISDQQTRDAVLSDAVRCDTLQPERQWLDCYYSAARVMRTKLGLPGGNRALPTQGKIEEENSGREHATNGQNFGLPPAAPKSAVRHVTSRLATYSFDRYGIFTVTLSNGEVWRQIGGDTTYAHWKQPASTYTVDITRGALGSYNLRVRNGTGLFKVERIS